MTAEDRPKSALMIDRQNMRGNRFKLFAVQHMRTFFGRSKRIVHRFHRRLFSFRNCAQVGKIGADIVCGRGVANDDMAPPRTTSASKERLRVRPRITHTYQPLLRLDKNLRPIVTRPCGTGGLVRLGSGISAAQQSDCAKDSR